MYISVGFIRKTNLVLQYNKRESLEQNGNKMPHIYFLLSPELEDPFSTIQLRSETAPKALTLLWQMCHFCGKVTFRDVIFRQMNNETRKKKKKIDKCVASVSLPCVSKGYFCLSLAHIIYIICHKKEINVYR